MQALQNNLEGKSKQYRDQALTHLFLMNNIHYIVRSVRRYVIHIYWPYFEACGNFLLITCQFRSEAKDLLGDDWVQRHRRIVQQNANLYKRIAWAKVLFFLVTIFEGSFWSMELYCWNSQHGTVRVRLVSGNEILEMESVCFQVIYIYP